jgi:ABC-type glutathione transport system ATPase component
MASLQQIHQQPKAVHHTSMQRRAVRSSKKPFVARATPVQQRSNLGSITVSTDNSISIRAFNNNKPTARPQHLFSSRISAVPPMPMGEEFEANNKQYAELTKEIEAAAAIAQEGLGGTSLYLVGMMGSGKSTVGKLVSQALGYCFFDTDALIEQLAGKTIPEIFADDGEEDFRAIETQVLMVLFGF